MDDEKLKFEQLGGRKVLEQISKRFYDKVYEHPWIGLYFKDIAQEVIESQQVDFMSMSLGGPKVYLGKLPIAAHRHMMITEELFQIRQDLLIQAMDELNVLPELKQRWLKIDEAFRPRIVKNSFDDCEKRFKTDSILYFENPIARKVA